MEANQKAMNNDLLTGKNISIRAMEPGDVDLLYEWENDTSIWQVSNTLTPFSKFQLKEFVLNAPQDIFSTRQLRLMIDLIHKNQPKETIGAIDFFEYDPFHLRAGIGILIRRSYREKGYAGEALKILIRYAFETLRLHQLFCNISPDNEPSIRLFTKAGFVQCGNKKEWNNTGETWNDEWMFQFIHKKS
ncbi:MAG: GNAT family N-acetyltransferase [Bacteroidales bacterium]|jgi:diamine N-acetyltransferase|nr:GNAT family N-acetyltransferase [Bacteroidales bacterium]